MTAANIVGQAEKTTIASDVADLASDNEILVLRTVSDLVTGSEIALKDRMEFYLPSLGQK